MFKDKNLNKDNYGIYGLDVDANLGTLASGIMRAHPNKFFTFLADIDAGGSGAVKESYGVEDYVISSFAVTDLGGNTYGIGMAMSEFDDTGDKMDNSGESCLVYGVRDLGSNTIISEDWSQCVTGSQTWGVGVTTDGTDFFFSVYVDSTSATDFDQMLLLAHFDNTGT